MLRYFFFALVLGHLGNGQASLSIRPMVVIVWTRCLCGSAYGLLGGLETSPNVCGLKYAKGKKHRIVDLFLRN